MNKKLDIINFVVSLIIKAVVIRMKRNVSIIYSFGDKGITQSNQTIDLTGLAT